MAKYKLLKDLPGLKKGTILSEGKSIFGARTLITKNDGVGPIFISNDLTEGLFEEIKEPTDSIHWKPKNGERYYTPCVAGISSQVWRDDEFDMSCYELGETFRTEEECGKARDRRLAEVRLRRTSTFEPDFENDNGGWVVYYNPRENRLEVQEVYRLEYGEIVCYETEKDALKSIEENERDWRIYFGVEE